MPIGIGLAVAGGLGAAASLYGASRQSHAASDAAGLQAAMFNQTRGDLQPWMKAGSQSLQQLMQQFGGAGSPGNAPFTLQNFQASPAYQFNLQQGQDAINKAANARGNYYAPQTLQDIGRFSQGLASNEFQNAFANYNSQQGNLFNRLFSESGMGQSAANQTGAFGANAANQMGQYGTQAANANAAGAIGATNAISGAYGQYLNNQIIQQILNRPTYGGGGAWSNAMAIPTGYEPPV